MRACVTSEDEDTSVSVILSPYWVVILPGLRITSCTPLNDLLVLRLASTTIEYRRSEISLHFFVGENACGLSPVLSSLAVMVR